MQKIIHVDDDADICAIAKMSLELIGGFDLRQFRSGAEAIAKAGDFVPDIFLLDYMMPEMNGEETYAALRTLPGFGEIPAIFMTARVQHDVSAALMQNGALAVIPKPFDPMELPNLLRKAWAQRSR